MSKRIIHFPLEPYRERYTEFLHIWEEAAFKTEGTDYTKVSVENFKEPLLIQSGQVLDAKRRPQYAMAQSIEAVKAVSIPSLDGPPSLYFSDFYHTGLDGIAYAEEPQKLSVGKSPKAAYLWAQSFDQYDFTCRMLPWMRFYEVMAFEIYDHVFVASSLLKELIVAALPHVAEKVHVVGLPFNSEYVRALPTTADLPGMQFDVVYSSRWDAEKQPMKFIQLAEKRDDLTFAVCTGSYELHGGDEEAVARAKQLAERRGDRFRIFEACTKRKYYGVLNASKVQFNCALQDWVSFTLLEALTFRCFPLYPNFRSFPEALGYTDFFMYAPDEPTDLEAKLGELLTLDKKNFDPAPLLRKHDGALKTIRSYL